MDSCTFAPQSTYDQTIYSRQTSVNKNYKSRISSAFKDASITLNHKEILRHFVPQDDAVKYLLFETIHKDNPIFFRCPSLYYMHGVKPGKV
jgi:hypothetical protein